MIKPDVHERLAARGIDPERSAEEWVAAIRDGSFPVGSDGLPRRPRYMGPAATREKERLRALIGLPLAVVLPDVD